MGDNAKALTVRSDKPELANAQEFPALEETRTPWPSVAAIIVRSELNPGENASADTVGSVKPCVTGVQLAPALVEPKIPFALLPAKRV